MNVNGFHPFNCPHCGAPGNVTYGLANYSCMCRMRGNTYAPLPPAEDGCRPLRELTEEDVRRIVRDELGKTEGEPK